MPQESSPALQTMEIPTFRPPDEVAFSQHVACPYSICKYLTNSFLPSLCIILFACLREATLTKLFADGN